MQKAFVLLVISLCGSLLSGQVPESDSLALVALYNNTNGTSWTNNTNWLRPGQPVSTWYGITITNKRVTTISLPENNLNGSLPPEIGDLSLLQNLSLFRNQLTGSIPSEIGNLIYLSCLNLFSNELTGSIPSEIGELLNLDYLYLRDNQLSGTLPITLGNLNNLLVLSLRENELHGAIPGELANLGNLEEISLRNNQFNGSIPAYFGDLTNLEYISLGYNEFNDSIPEELGNLNKLRSLDLNVNQLTGSIPEELGNLGNLEHLVLANNQLTGTIPHELGDLNNLEYLGLSYNELTGPIPEEFSNLINLVELSLGNNKLNGLIPSGIADLALLAEVEIPNNNFTFYDLKPMLNLTVEYFQYAPQNQVELNTYQIFKNSGEDLTLDITELSAYEIETEYNQYQWWKDDDTLTTYSDSPILYISDLDSTNHGYYHCSIINSDFPELTLYTDSVSLIMDGAPNTLDPFAPTSMIYPNPTSGEIIISIIDSKSNPVIIEIINGSGSIVYADKLYNGIQQIDLHAYPNGLYLVKLSGNTFNCIRKVIVKH